MRKDEHLSFIPKEDFLKAIIKSHLEMLGNSNHHNREVFKMITILLIIMIIALTILVFLIINIIGTTAAQIIYAIFFFFCVGIYFIRNDLKQILIQSKKDLQVLTEYQKEIELMKSFSALGAAVPNPTSMLKGNNLLLSPTYKEFQNLVSLLHKYLPSNLYQEDIKTLETYGMHLSEDITLFGEKEGYIITYF